LCKEEEGKTLTSDKNHWPDAKEQRRMMNAQRIMTVKKEWPDNKEQRQNDSVQRSTTVGE